MRVHTIGVLGYSCFLEATSFLQSKFWFKREAREIGAFTTTLAFLL